MDLLTLFKFAGIIVSGALGILGTITETRDKRTGRLTVWGKWALSLTITGLVVALGAQIFESIQKKREEEASAKQATKLLGSVLGILTGFNKVTAKAVFELPPMEPRVKNLADEIEHLAIQTSHTNRSVQWPTGIWRGASNIVHVIPKSIKDPNLVAKVKPIYDFLTTERPHLILLQVDQQRKQGEMLPKILGQPVHDLSIGNDSTNPIAGFCYSLETHRFHFDIPFESAPAKEWTSNRKVVGLSDLNSAKLTVHTVFIPEPNHPLFPLFTGCQLVRFEASFGNNDCTVESFTPMAGKANRFDIIYEATLPDSDAILNHRAYKFHPF